MVLLLLGLWSPLVAQGPTSPAPVGRWMLLDAIGYGGAGFGVGLVAAWGMEGTDFGPPDEALIVIGATTVAGTLAGAMLGRGAERALAAGDALGAFHRIAVPVGAVLAGGTIGALAAIPLVDPDGEDTVLGSDEMTVALLVGAGSALGGLYVWRHRHAFSFGRASVAPSIRGRSGYGFEVRLIPAY